jgi:dTMP kinase
MQFVTSRHYLTTNGPTGSVDDRAIHLLFSANRWESAPKLASTLASGTNIVCDRYAYSGVAFTSAKVEEDRSSMSGGELTLEWCMGPDCGLPAPDCVIFLDLDQEEAEKRGG